MNVPLLGEVVEDTEFGWYRSEAIPIPMFGGKKCRIVLDGYENDSQKEDFHVAIVNFLSSGVNVLRRADEAVFRYYKDSEYFWKDTLPEISHFNQLWEHIQFGTEAFVERRQDGDRAVYISLECECDWEREHGLQIVLKNGIQVNKIGQYDGHLTNSDSFADPRFEDVIYVGHSGFSA